MSSSKVTELSPGLASISSRSPRIVAHKRLLRQNQPLTQWLQWAMSVAAVIGLLYVLVAERTGGFSEHYRVLAAVTVMLMVIVYHVMGVFRRYSSPWADTVRLARAWLVVCTILMLLGLVTKTTDFYSRQVVLTWFAGGIAAQCLASLTFHAMSRVWQLNLKVNLPVLVIGTGSLARRLIDSINRNVFLADHVIGVVDDERKLESWHGGESVPALGSLDALHEVMATNVIDRVYIALPLDASSEVARLHRELRRFNVDLIWVPDIFSLELLNPSVREVAGIPLISLSESPLSTGGQAYLKSLMDVCGALAAVILLAPVMIAAAAAIKLTSRGPILYQQTRTGWDGGRFRIWKFRTMYLHDEEPGRLVQARRDDGRVTPVGRLLRRTSIDELPQLFNVLGGTMSLVGPRPHSIIHDDEYARQIDAYLVRHRIKPGMTGWAQIHGCRGETRTVDEMRRRVEFDIEYINRWSLWLDSWILLRTPMALFSKRAY